jgi:hypothetical protein
MEQEYLRRDCLEIKGMKPEKWLKGYEPRRDSVCVAVP